MAADKVLSIPILEQTNPVYDIILSAGFIVRGCLDPAVLRNALTELVNRWRILGSRVARNSEGRFELRLPESFSDARPPFIFTTEDSPNPYPSMPSRQVLITTEFAETLDFFRTSGTPRKVPDLLKLDDSPMLYVHIHRFSDVTCVGVHIPHLFCDVPGLGIILRAWCSLVSASDDMQSVELPPLIEGDPLADFGKPYPTTKAEREAFKRSMLSSFTILGRLDTLRYFGKMALDLMTHKEECRMVFIPQKVVRRMKEETMSVLAKEDEGKFVSENDIVTALLTKMHMYNRDSPSQPLTLAFSANLRGQIPALPSSPSSPVHIRNALTLMAAPALPVSDFRQMPISRIAIHVRETINAQRTLEQMSMSVTAYREMARLGKLPVFGNVQGTSFFVTSWVAAKWSELDFSGAVLHKETEKEDPMAGRVLFTGGTAVNPTFGSAGQCRWAVIMSKVAETESGEAGYWCHVGARLSAWPEIEKFVASW